MMLVCSNKEALTGDINPASYFVDNVTVGNSHRHSNYLAIGGTEPQTAMEFRCYYRCTCTGAALGSY